MAPRKILYISGSLGLGHVLRDLAIANALRERIPAVELTWLASAPATSVLESAGEALAPEIAQYADDSAAAESAASVMRVNIFQYTLHARKAWSQNVEAFRRATAREGFDLVIADEAYEVLIELRRKPALKKSPFVMIYDFVGLDPMTRNPLEILGAYYLNWIWAQDHKVVDRAFFVGELEDIPDKPFGLLLPNRRRHAESHYQPVGYVLPFDPAQYADQAQVRARLGYGDGPLIICSIGGTAIGKELLELCVRAYPTIKDAIPGTRMIVVCGPRLSPASLDAPEGVEVKGYVPALYEHLAACDLAIVQGGGTTTLELTALRRPFIYFPLEEHCEQQVTVAGRLARQRAGIRMSFPRTNPERLAEEAIASLGRAVDYSAIRVDGADRAAQLICGLL
jgi:UDP:flavonoid glycosyltransferase YjiC (YdhE family)